MYVTKVFPSPGGWRLKLCTRKATPDPLPETSRSRESMPSNRALSGAAAPARMSAEKSRSIVLVEGVAAFED